jgi:hypothetical protein
VATAVTPAA